MVLSITSINDNFQSEKESLYQNFYLRAHAFSLEVRTYLKDKVDLQADNTHLAARGQFTNVYELPVPDSVRHSAQVWLNDNAAGGALIEFYTDSGQNKPRLLYLEKKYGRRYFVFAAQFLSQLLDISQNIGTDDRIFIYNAREEPFLSNTIEAGYQVTADWQAAIHRLFWQHELNGIQEVSLKDARFIIARYRLRDLPLVVYLARPYALAMSGVEASARRLVVIYSFVALIVFLLMMYVFRDQLKSLRHLRAFMAGSMAAIRARRVFLVRDERSDIFAEIISIRQKEKQALYERDDAMERTRAKADFLASMSHEIRNPLNAILGIADLLRERASDAESRKYLQIMRDSGDSLLQIINDILDISKIENNRLTLEAIAFDISKLIADLQFFYSARAAENKNQIIIQTSPRLSGRVLGDATRVRQVILNLMSNAVKFTENGKIYIRAGRVPESDEVNIFVHDTGIGISKENISRIFAAYEQAEASTTRQYGGTGLGLNIALKLARLMHGTVRCRSRVGRGTTFFCRLHLPVVAEKPEPVRSEPEKTAMAENLSGLRVLVAEDNEINQMLMTENLKNTVIAVGIAENGKEALAMAAAEPWDLIFMDMVMPEMDGLEATRAIRLQEILNGRQRVPIVALSGNAMAEDIEAAANAGCDAHLAKPARKEQLIEVLSKFCPAKIQKES